MSDTKKNPQFRLKAQGSLLTLFSLGLVGCGFSSPNVAPSNVPPSVGGTAVKGLLEGAEAFVDTDGDGVWTEGVDSAKATTAADGTFSIETSLTGDLVVITNANTVDQSSGQILDGVTLSAPQGYDVVSVATTITNELMDSSTSLTADEAESQVKSMLGINSDVDIANFNPFSTENTGSAEAVAYEKVAQQVMTVINTLAVAEENFDTAVDRGAALDNAFGAFVDVMEDAAATATTNQSTITAIDFTSSSTLVADVVGKYDSSSAMQSTSNSAAITAIKTAVEAVNDAIDTVTDLEAGKELFAVAQANLVDSAAAVANTGDTNLMTIDATTDLSALLIVSGGRSNIEENSKDGLTTSGTLKVKDPDTEDTITYEFDPSTLVFQGTGSALGSLSIEADGSWTYAISGNPDSINGLSARETFTETFKVTVNAVDSSDSSSTATSTHAYITVTINGENDAPVIVEAKINEDHDIAEDTAIVESASADYFTDPEGDTLTFSATLNDAALPDSLTLSEDGVVSGFLGNDHVGENTVMLTATDTAGNKTTATIEFTVTNVNDAPTSTAIADGAVNEDSAYSTDVSSHFADVDTGDSLSYSLSGAPDSITINAAGVISGTPLNADSGTHTITVTATDGSNATTSQNFDLVITNINDAPTGAIAITGKNSEEETLTADTSAVADDDNLGDFSYAWMRDGVAIDGATSSTYVLVRDDIGSLITVQVVYTDGSGNNESLTSAPTNAITEINHAATGNLAITGTAADNATLTLDTSAIADQNGIDSEFAITWQRDGVNIADSNSATLTLTDADVGAIITASATFEDSLGATETVTTATGTSAVVDVNDAPTSTAIAAASGTEDSALSLDVSGTFTDVDAGDSLTFTATGLPSTLSMSTAGVITGTPLNADVGDLSIVVTATDSGGETSAQTFTLSVANTNDAPTVSPIGAQTLAEDTAFSVDISSFFTDVDTGDNLTFSATIGTDNITISEAGVISGTPLQSDVGTHTVTITATDTSGESVSGDVSITVTNVNDPTIGTADWGGATYVGHTISAAVTATDKDGIPDANNDGKPDSTIQWLRDGVAITDATTEEYTITAEDLGAVLSATFVVTDTLNNETTFTTSASSVVTESPFAPAVGISTASSVQNGSQRIDVYITEDSAYTQSASFGIPKYGASDIDVTVNFDSSALTYQATTGIILETTTADVVGNSTTPSDGSVNVKIPWVTQDLSALGQVPIINEEILPGEFVEVTQFGETSITYQTNDPIPEAATYEDVPIDLSWDFYVDYDTPIFSMWFEEINAGNETSLSFSGTIDGQVSIDAAINIGRLDNHFNFQVAGTDYVLVADAMDYAAATSHAASLNGEIATVSEGDPLMDVFVGLVDDMADIYNLDSMIGQTTPSGSENMHVWLSSTDNNAAKLYDDIITVDVSEQHPDGVYLDPSAEVVTITESEELFFVIELV